MQERTVSDLTRCVATFGTALKRSAQLARSLEHGQSGSNLSGYFDRLAREFLTAPFQIDLIAETPAALTRVLEWLSGDIGLTVGPWIAASRSGNLILSMTRPTYGLRLNQGSDQQVETEGALIDRLKSLLSDPNIHALTLMVPPVRGLRPVRVVVHPCEASPQNDPPTGNMTIVATQTLSMSREFGARLMALSMHPMTLWPVVTHSVPATSAAADWVQVIGIDRCLPASFIPVRSTSFPPWLATDHDVLRGAILLSDRARDLEMALLAMQTEISLREERLRVALGMQKRSRLLKDRPGNPVQDTIKEIGLNTGERVRRLAREFARSAWLTDSHQRQDLERRLHQLGVDSIQITKKRKKKALTLAPQVRAELVERMKSGLSENVCSVTAQAQQELDRMADTIQTELSTKYGGNFSLRAARLDTAKLSNIANRDIVLGLQFEEVLPRRGVLARLGEGRRAVIIPMMSISMFGGLLGLSLRQSPSLGYALLGLFIVSVAWTFVSWRQDDRDRVAEAAERLHRGLAGEAERIVSTATREIEQVMVEDARQLLQALQARALELASTREREDQSSQKAKDRIEESRQLRLKSEQDGLSAAKSEVAACLSSCADASKLAAIAKGEQLAWLWKLAGVPK